MLGKRADGWEIVEGVRALAVDTEPDMIKDQLEIGMSRGKAIEMIERPWHKHHDRNACPFSRWPYPVCRPVGKPRTIVCTVERQTQPQHAGL
jgi:hypothetical protein